MTRLNRPELTPQQLIEKWTRGLDDEKKIDFIKDVYDMVQSQLYGVERKIVAKLDEMEPKP